MRVVHLTDPGTELRADGLRLLVVSAGVVVRQLPLPLLDRLVVHGAVHITAAALARILSSGVDVVFLTAGGHYRGRLEHPGATPVELRLRQALAAADAAHRTRFARVIVRNKLHGQRRVLHALRLEIPPGWRQAARTLHVATTVNEISGCEGLATRAYFGAIRAALGGGPHWTRRRRPPPDPINALLSYVYAIVMPIAHCAVQCAGLDPYLGLLHVPGRGRPSLTLDFLEELRAPFCDFIVLRGVRQLGASTWWVEDAEGGGIRLTEDAREWAIRTVEERLLRRTYHLASGRAFPWIDAIERQADALARAIREDKPERYRPLAVVRKRPQPWT